MSYFLAATDPLPLALTSRVLAGGNITIALLLFCARHRTDIHSFFSDGLFQPVKKTASGLIVVLELPNRISQPLPNQGAYFHKIGAFLPIA